MTNTDAKYDLSDLAQFGEGKVAYIRSLTSEEVPALFPEAPKLAPGLTLFALLSADGTPIMLTDSHDTAVANAWQNDLEMVSVH
jgi:hypothetical protein